MIREKDSETNKYSETEGGRRKHREKYRRWDRYRGGGVEKGEEEN